MYTTEYTNIFKNESRHFYYRATHDLVLKLMRAYVPKQPSLSILDVGCGTGLLGKKMSSMGPVVGVDISSHALRYAKKRGLSVVRGSVERLPFPDESFDVVTCIDVLYHLRVKDDHKAVFELYRVLKPQGILIIRVPALSWLKSSHDRVVQTRHRYEKEELRHLLVQSGFHLRKLSYIHMALLPFAVVEYFKTLLYPVSSPRSSIRRPLVFINYIASAMLMGENRILRHINLPFGLGLVAVSEK